jgi:ATP-binding cassette subfamily C protein CydCD
MKPIDPRTLPLLRPARAALVVVVAAGTAGGVLLVGQAFAVAALVTGLHAAPAAATWHASAWRLLGLTAARAALTALSDAAAARAAGRVSTALRVQVLEAAFRLGRRRLSQRRSGELGLLATRGVAAVEPYLTRFVPTLVLAAVLPVLTLAVVVVEDLWAGVIVLATLPLVPVFAVLIGLATRDRADRQYRTLAQLAGHFLDVVRGLPTLVTFNRAERQSAQIRAVTERYRRATMATLRTAFASSAALELIATLSVALVAVCVGLRLAAGGLDFRTALVVLLLAPEAYWPLRRVGAEFHAAAEGAATLTEVTRLLAEAGVAAGDPAGDPGSAERRLDVDPVPIHVEDLVVRYDGATRAALVLPRAVVPATGITAVVGPSGSGKSTFVQALLGELEPESGRITLAGAAHDPERWRCLVAQVPQVPWLTAGTIAANLRLGRPRASHRRLWAALAEVELADVVAALPRALDTPLGEDGAGLSAGQRARLALARVLLADRPYVVLDEPTAHLDAETERILLATLRRLAGHRTVVVVAHRPAVVAAADHVITLGSPAPGAPLSGSATSTAPTACTVPDEAGPDSGPFADRLRTRVRRRLALATTLATGASLSGVALTATAGWLIARSAERPPVLMLMVAIVGVRTFGLARPVLRYAERLVGHDVALRLLADTRARVYDLLVPLAPARLGGPGGRHRGDLLTSVVDDVDAVLDDQLRVRLPVRSWLAVTLVAAVLVGWVHPPAVVPLLALGLVGGGLALAAGRLGAHRAERTFVEQRAALAAELVGDLQDARQLVLWQADAAALDRVRARGVRLAGAASTTGTALGLARALLVLLGGAGVVATAVLTAPALATGSVSGPMAALLLLVPLALVDVLLPLAEAGALSVRTAAARRRLTTLEAWQPAVVEPSEPLALTDPGSLHLDGVRAGWDRAAGQRGVDLALPQRAPVGIIGPSGSGKSTLAALLVRHLQPHSGHYTLGGVDTAALGSAEVRRHVGLVGDDPYVFASSLRENLRLAAPGATDAPLVQALGQAGLGDWLAALPHGLDTFLGDGGADVSGGERARLGIARALLADPAVLVLDEPTAHLDTATARAVTDTLLTARAGRSVVWISHDGVALDRLDGVLSMADGRLVGQSSGDRDDLHPGLEAR